MKSRNERIDSLRGILFISIFLAHAHIGSGGVGGVAAFTIISGCFMTIGNWDGERNCDVKALICGTAKRIRKHYILHIICMISAMAYYFRNVNVIRVIMNCLLIQAWSCDSYDYFSLNAVSWYLSALIFCYCMFPLFIVWVKRCKKPLLAICCIYIGLLIFAIIAGVFIECLKLNREGYNIPQWLLYVNPVYNSCIFFIGCLLGKLFVEDSISGTAANKSKKFWIFIEIFLIVSIVMNEYLYAFRMALAKNECFRYSLIFIPQEIILVVLVYKDKGLFINRILTWPIFKILGKYSGSMYLIHFLPITICTQYHNGTIWSRCFAMLVCLGFTLLAAIIYEKAYSMIRDKIKKKLG